MRKLFLLEDDLSLISGLTFAFKKQGFALDTARTLAEAEVLWSDRKYDLLVLDVSLPDGSGFDFCQKVRRTSNVPILFLTASDEEMNIIMGLDMGGDDYLTKPFHLAELNARVRSVIRRNTAQGSAVQELGNVQLDLDQRLVQVGDEALPINRKEYDILSYLILNQNRLVQRSAPAEHVWGDYMDEADDYEFLYSQVKNLRRKLKDARATVEIRAVYGIGYRLETISSEGSNEADQ